MNKEEYIEMLIQDLKDNSLAYWNSTQDEMVEALRELQQENKQLKEEKEEFKEWFENEYHLNLSNEFAEFECTDEKILKIYNKIKELEEGVK